MPSKRTILKYFFVIVAIAWTMVPVYWMLNLSLMFENEVTLTPPHFIPYNPTDYWYRRLLGYAPLQVELSGGLSSVGSKDLTFSLLNSVKVALPVALATILVSSFVGYAFGRLKFRRKNLLLFFLLGSRSVPPVSIMIPYFIFFTRYVKLYGTSEGLMLVYFATIAPLISWIMMGYFAGLPVEIERAARIDGCSRVQALFRVILPMAKPGLASSFVLTFIFCFNEFLYAMILTMGTPAATLPSKLTELFFMQSAAPQMSAILIIAILIPIAIALIFQRYITELKIVDPVSVMAE